MKAMDFKSGAAGHGLHAVRRAEMSDLFSGGAGPLQLQVLVDPSVVQEQEGVSRTRACSGPSFGHSVPRSSRQGMAETSFRPSAAPDPSCTLNQATCALSSARSWS